MEVGLVRKVDIDREMQQSYMDFAMSVIVARALPDARDGMKPVQRRILYAMYDMGLRSDTSYKKSARIVGEVLGKYHPHGDMAVYEAMARLAQDFSMRYPLVDGQGNFGSVDGDPPAAMRYTEARLKPFAIDLLTQLERDTVNFSANFDDSLVEPDVLPAAIPNLLVNGSTGIAVGMATSIPPHNLTEVIDALTYLLEKWDHLDDISVSDLMRFIKGPDFPTGGVILQDQNNDLLTAYATGKGRLLVRGQVHMEDTGRGRSRLIINELPYMTNKSSLIERIAELVREGRLEGIADLRDESDRQGMRIVIELSKTGDPESVLRDLYRRTPLESSIGFNLLALVDGEPRLLTLKQALRVYLDHRITVIKRRSEFDLAKAKARAHLLEGLRIAIANLEEIIKTIRASADVEQARERLIKRFKLSEIQAQAILDMPLRRLAALERKKIEDEYKEVGKQIKDLEGLLNSPKQMREVVEAELMQMRQTYGDRRRTQIVFLKEGDSAHTMLMTNDLTPAEEVWVSVTADGLISRSGSDAGLNVGGTQAPRWLVRTNTHHTLYLILTNGQAAAVAVHALPEAVSPSDGQPISKVSAVPEDEHLAAVFSVPPRSKEDSTEHFIVTATTQGLVKKSAVADLPGPSSQRFTLVKVNPDDQLLGAVLSGGDSHLFLLSERGMAIRFSEQEVRPMGLVAAGVNGMKLAEGDRLIGFDIFQPDGEILMIARDGTAWRVAGSDFPQQGRYGQGVIACKLGTGRLAGLLIGKSTHTGMLNFVKAAARGIKIGDIPAGRRAGTGKMLVSVKGGDQVTVISNTVDLSGFWNPAAALKSVVGRKPRAARGSKPDTQQPAAVQAALPMPGAKKTSSVKSAKPAVRAKVAQKASAGSIKTIASKDKPASSASVEKVAKKTATAPSAASKTKAVPKEKKPAASVQKKTTAAKPGKSVQTITEGISEKKARQKTAVKTVKKPASKSTPVSKPAEPQEPQLIGLVRTSGKVVEVSSGGVKSSRKKATQPSLPVTAPKLSKTPPEKKKIVRKPKPPKP